MNKFSKIFALAFTLVMISTTAALADNAKFTPLNFDDSNAISVPRTTSTTSNYSSSTTPKGTDLLDASQVTAGPKMENSILQIENAQVEIRNKLLKAKTEFAEVDSRYKAVKAERKDVKKQIKYAEKKIKNLDNAKKKIRKNFERKINI